jgi:hypothetical protein
MATTTTSSKEETTVLIDLTKELDAQSFSPVNNIHRIEFDRTVEIINKHRFSCIK